MSQELIDAARDGDKARLNVLIPISTNIEFRDEYGYTSLMTAAYNGKKEVCEQLIKAGANFTARAGYKGNNETAGKSVLEIAQIRGHLDIMNLISYYEGKIFKAIYANLILKADINPNANKVN